MILFLLVLAFGFCFVFLLNLLHKLYSCSMYIFWHQHKYLIARVPISHNKIRISGKEKSKINNDKK